jgi:hypothetical protein
MINQIRRRNHIRAYPSDTTYTSASVFAHFDASVKSSLITQTTSSIEYVNQWNPIQASAAGRNFIQTDMSRRPIYLSAGIKGKPCVKFIHDNNVGTHDYMNDTNVAQWQAAGMANCSLIIAFRQTNKSVSGYTGDATQAGAYPISWEGFHCGVYTSAPISGIPSSYTFLWWNATRTTNVNPGGGFMGLNTFCAGYWDLGPTFAATTVRGQSYDYGPFRSTVTIDRYQFTPGTCKLGAPRTSNASYTNPFEGEIYEIILYSGHLTPSERLKTLEYIRAKWGP